MIGYNIANKKINIECNNEYLENRLIPFGRNTYRYPDMTITIEKCRNIKEPKGEVVVDDHVVWLKKKDADGFNVIRKDESQKYVLAHLDTDSRWSNVRIKCLDIPKAPTEKYSWSDYYSFMLTGIAFRNNIIHDNGIVIHSSSISWNGKGLLFTAPSGTGKSTHVRLWEKYFENAVTVVNDDTPAIRIIDDIPVLCGTPWSGSSDKFTDDKVPLHAIVILEQALQNSIRKLSLPEALPRLMPRCFLPYFDEELMEKASMVIGKLVSTIPVYFLQCRPDKEAMELVHKCVV